ncbi:MAG: hypothetical protein JSV88_32930 [Candidatus Aminicenantes bacterium]|nr:MAG: hypothetical protein JSV88_32930 [Candidatus Aminicenantes bacterium]
MTNEKPLTGIDQFVLGLLGILIVFVFIFMLRDVAAFGVDDSFIFFRYAENAANGHGFVFNAGEPAGEGFTSWVWLLMLAFFHYIGVNIIVVSKVLGILFHLVSGFLVFLLVLRTAGKEPVSKVTAGILAAGFLLNYRLTAHSVSGMETSLYIFSLVLLIYLTTLALQSPGTQYRWWLIISLCTLGLFLVRPEGIAAGGISLLALGIHQRQCLLKPMVWFYVVIGLVAPLALFIALKFVIFGYPLPHSYYHKLIVIDEEYVEAFRKFLLFLQTYWWLVIAALLTALYSIIKRKKYLFVYYAVLFFFMTGIYLLFYPAMNYLHRFYIPYLPLLLLMVVPALHALVEKVNQMRYGFLQWLSLALVVVLLVVGINPGLEISKKKVKSWSRLVNPRLYRAKLGKLMSHLPANVVVANTEMGVIPYYSGLTCIDMAGLTDPHISHHGLSMGYLNKRKVDLILFSRYVPEVSAREWDKYTLNYKAVFLSDKFKKDFVCIGAFNAWPGGRKKYYLYADKTSSGFAAVQRWRQRYASELEQ